MNPESKREYHETINPFSLPKVKIIILYHLGVHPVIVYHLKSAAQIDRCCNIFNAGFHHAHLAVQFYLKRSAGMLNLKPLKFWSSFWLFGII